MTDPVPTLFKKEIVEWCLKSRGLSDAADAAVNHSDEGALRYLRDEMEFADVLPKWREELTREEVNGRIKWALQEEFG